MPLSPEGEQLVSLLERLELELRQNDLWGKRSPGSTALESRQPFAWDTMHFFEWLQWLCVPRLYELALENNRLPADSEMCVAAEIFLQNEGRAAPNLVALVRALDDELNARWVGHVSG